MFYKVLYYKVLHKYDVSIYKYMNNFDIQNVLQLVLFVQPKIIYFAEQIVNKTLKTTFWLLKENVFKMKISAHKHKTNIRF